MNRGGVILSQSHAVSRVLGYERGKLLGTNIFDLVHEQDVSAVYFAFFEVIEGFCENTTVRFLHRAPDGSYRMIEAAVGKLRDSCSAGVVFSLRLISNPPPRRTDQAWPGAPDMPPDGEERECIMLSHGRRVPLSRDSGPAWAAVDPA